MKSTDYSCRNGVMEGLQLLLSITCTIYLKVNCSCTLSISLSNSISYNSYTSFYSWKLPYYSGNLELLILYALRFLLFQKLFQHNVLLPTCLPGHVRIAMVNLELHSWHLNLIHHNYIYYFCIIVHYFLITVS